jgi:hypothetical protein
MNSKILAVTFLLVSAAGAQAKQIERACLKSDRNGAGRALCGCIQDVADLTLSTRDQKLAARFFADPQKAQDIRQSDRRSYELFWERYKEFGEAAEEFCRS